MRNKSETKTQKPSSNQTAPEAPANQAAQPAAASPKAAKPARKPAPRKAPVDLDDDLVLTDECRPLRTATGEEPLAALPEEVPVASSSTPAAPAAPAAPPPATMPLAALPELVVPVAATNTLAWVAAAAGVAALATSSGSSGSTPTPTVPPTSAPTVPPTAAPTTPPTTPPTEAPTTPPTTAPTTPPTTAPTTPPTTAPTTPPTTAPTTPPTTAPTTPPTSPPTEAPTAPPTPAPSVVLTGRLTSTSANDTGVSPTDGITSNTTPEISGTTEPGAKVTVRIDGVDYETTADASGHYSVAIPSTKPLTDGAYVPELKVVAPSGVTATGTGTPFVVQTSTTPPPITGGLTHDAASDTGASQTDNLTRNRNPEISGSTEPGAQVRVTINGGTYTTTADANGFYSVVVGDSLPDGAHMVGLSVTGANGVTSTGVGMPIVVDGSGPPVTGRLTPNAANDTGASASDGLTTVATPEISGSTEALTPVEVTINGKTYSTTSDANGRYSISVPAADKLAPGSYTPVIRATDAAGNATTVNGTPFTVLDAASNAITGQLTSTPANDTGSSQVDGITSNNRPAISGVTKPGNTVTVELNGASYVTVADSAGNYSVSVGSALPDGRYTATLTSTSPSGITSTGTAGPFVIDTTPPAASGGLTQDTTNDTGPSATDGITNNRTPEISGSTAANVPVQVTINGKTYSTTSDSSGFFAVAIPTADALRDGTYTPQIRVVDAAGNISTVAGTSFSVLAGNPAIIGGLTQTPGNDTGASSSDGITSNATPELSGVTQPGATVNVLLNGITYTTVADASGRYAIVVPASNRLPDGSYTAQLTTTTTGGVSTTMSAEPFTVDSVGPSATGGLTPVAGNDTGTSNSDGLTGNRAPEISGTTAANAVVAVTINGKTYTTTADAGGRYAVTVPVADALPDGNYTPLIRVTDAAGNVATSSGTRFTVLAENPGVVGGLTATVGNDTGSSQTDSVTRNNTPEISGVTQPGNSVAVRLNGITYTTTADSNGNFAVQVPASARLADGSYPLRISVTNSSGLGAVFNGAPIVVDTSAPAASGGLTANAANDTGPSASDGVTTNRTPEISGSTEPDTAVQVTVNGQTYSTTSDSAGRYAITIPAADALPDGTYTPQIRVTDQAGNTATVAGTPLTILAGNPSIVGGLTQGPGTDTGRSSSDGVTSDSTPEISGATNPGSTVTVVLNGVTYTTTADSSGRYAITVPAGAALPDGSYTATLTTTTPAGLTATSTTAPIVIDTSAPVAIGGLTATPANDTGASSTDGITANRNPEFSGTTEPNTPVEVTLNGKTYTTTADSSGRYAITVPAADTLPDGTYSAQIRTTDAAGNSATAAGTPFTVQGTPLFVTGGVAPGSDTGASSSDGVTNDSTPQITGTTNPGNTVTMVLNGVSYSTVADAAGNYSITVPAGTPLPDGSYTAQLTTTTPGGLVATGTAGPFVVDTTPPAGASGGLSSTPANDTGPSSTDGITTNRTPEFSGTAEPGSTVAVTLNGKTYTTTADSSGHYSVTVPAADALPDGSYTAQIRTTDTAGNSSTSTSTPFTILASNPSIVGGLTQTPGADTGASSSDGITRDSTPEISGATNPGSTVTVLLNGVTYTTTADASGRFAITVPAGTPLADGSYTATLTTVTPAGLTATSTTPPIVIDTAPPPAAGGGLTQNAANDTGGSSTDGITANRNPEFSGSTDPGATVAVTINGKTYTTTADSSGHYAITVPPADALPDGVYTPQVVVTDPAGNSSTASGTPFTILASNPSIVGGLTPTAANDTGASSSDSVTSVQTPQISGATQPGSTVTLVLNGVTYTTTADNAGAYAFTVPAGSPLPDGSYTAQLTTITPSGLTASTTAGPIVVDTSAPAASGGLTANPANDTGSSASDGITANRTPQISGSTEPNSTVSVVINGRTYTTTSDASGNYAVTVPAADALPDGGYTPTIQVTDRAGNTSSTSGTPFIVLAANPSIVGGVTPTPGNDSGSSHTDGVTATRTPELSGATQPNSTVSVLLNGVTYTTTADASGAWSVTVPAGTPLPDGSYTATLTTTTPAGLTATSNSQPIVIDSTGAAATGGLAQTAASDTGPSASDGITANRAPQIAGSTEPNTAVSVAINGKTYTTTADAAGNYVVSIPPADALPDGRYTAQITTTDLAGNTLTTAATPFTVLADNPSIVGGVSPGAANDTGASSTDGRTSNRTPEISGATQPGSTVSVVLNGVTYTTTADAAGYYAITVPAGTPLPDGSYTATLTTTTPAGLSATSSSTPIIIDSTPASATGGLTANAANDTGASASDGVTANRSPQISGTTEPNTAVDVIVNGRTYSTTSDASGNYAITIPAADALPDGSYTPQIRTTDAAGNSATVAGTAFTVLAANPSIIGGLTQTASNDTGGSSGDGVTSNTTPEISGVTQPGSTVTVLLNGVTYTTTADASGNYAVAVPAGTPLPTGSYTATLTTTTPSGLTASTSIPVVIDTAAPTATGGLTQNSANDTGPSATDGITAVRTPEISGATEPNTAVQVTINGKTYSTTSDASGNYAITIPAADALPDGVYTPQIRVTDLAGNTATIAGTPLTVLADNPSIVGGLTPTAANDTGSSSSDGLTNDSTPEISGATNPNSTVTVVLNGVTYTTTADASGAWAVTVPAGTPLPDGSYPIQLTTVTPSGLTTSRTVGPVVIDTVAPAATGRLTPTAANDSGVSASDGITEIKTPEISGTTQPNVAVAVTINGRTYTTTSDASGNYAVTVPLADALPNATYTPQIVVTDAAGNTSTTAGTPFTVAHVAMTLGGGLTANAANDTGASASDRITSQKTPEISGSTKPGSSVSVVLNGVTYTTTADASGNFAVTVPAADTLADGTYTAQLTATSTIGETMTVAALPFTVDNVAPAVTGRLTANSTNDTGTSFSDSVTRVTTPQISGTTEPGRTVSVTVNGKTYTAVANAGGAYAITIPAADALADGTYTPVLSVTDLAGNTVTANGTPFTVLTQAPTVVGGLTANAANDTGASSTDGITRVTTPQISGTTQPNAVVTVQLNGKTYTTTADSAGLYSVTVPAADALPNGTFTPVITASNASGLNTTVNGRSFTVDTVGPAITGRLTSIAGNDTGSSSSDGLTANNTPEISGVTLALAPVSVTVGGVTYSTTADYAGKYSIAVPLSTPLADGTYTPLLSVVDPAGNVTTSNGTPFTVNTTQPWITGRLTSTPANDNGYLSNDSYTSVTTPQLSGKTLPGNQVTVVLNGKTYNTTADANGDYTITVLAADALPGGTYTAQLTTQDTFGAVATNSAIPFTVDTTPPQAPVINPVTSSVSPNDVINRLEKAAGTNVTGLADPYASVAVTWNGITHTVAADGMGNWATTFASAEVPPDTLSSTISAVATDSFGMISSPGTRTVRIDTSVAPATTATISDVTDDIGTTSAGGYPTGDATGSVAQSTSTDDTIPTLTGTLSAGLQANEVVQVFDGNILLGNATVTGTSWSFTGATPLAGAGMHTLSARVFNTITALNGTAATYTINEQTMALPSLTAHAGTQAGTVARYLMLHWDLPANGVLNLGELQALVDGVNVAAGLPATSFKIGPAGNSASGAPIRAVDGLGTTGYISTGAAQKQGWLQIDLGANYVIDTLRLTPLNNQNSPLANLRVYGSFNDMAAAIASSSTTANLIPSLAAGQGGASLIGVMPSAPSGVTDIQPATIVTTDLRPTLSGSLGTTLGAGEQVAIYNGATLMSLATVTGTEWTYTPVANMAANTYNLRVVIEDSVTKAVRIATGLTVTVLGTPTASVSIASVNDDVGTASQGGYPAGDATGAITSGNNSSDDSTPTLNGTLSSALKLGEEVRVYDGTTLLGSATVSGTTWTYTASLVGTGIHSLAARVYNTISGRTGALSVAQSFNLQSMSNIQVQQDASAPAYTTSDTTPTLFGTLGSVLSTGEVVGIYDGATRLGSATVTGGSWSYTPTAALATGIHTFTAKIELGGAVRLAISQNVTIVAPVVPTQSASVTSVTDATTTTAPEFTTAAYAAPNGRTIDDSRPALAGTLSAALTAGQVVQVFDNGALIGNATVSGTNWTLAMNATGMPALNGTGVHNITARVINTANGQYNDTGASWTVNLAAMSPILVSVNEGTFVNNTTEDRTPSFSGTLGTTIGANEEVAVYGGAGSATFLGLATVNGVNWTFTPSTDLNTTSHMIKVGIREVGAGNSFRLSRQQIVIIPAPAPSGVLLTEATITGATDDVGIASPGGYPAGDATGSVPHATSTDDPTVTLTGTITAALNPGEEVRIYDQGVLLGSATVTGTNWTFVTPALTDKGYHILMANVRNPTTGRSGPDSDVYYVIQNGLSDIIVSDDNGQPVNNNTTTDLTPKLSGKLEGGIGNFEQLAIYDNGVLKGTAIFHDDYTWTYDGTFALGTHNLEVRLENETTHTAKIAVKTTMYVAPASPPTATPTITTVSDSTGTAASGLSGDSTANVANGTSTNETRPVISGTLSSAMQPGEALEIYDGATLLGTANVTGTTWNFQPGTALNGLGAHQFTARVINNANLTTGPTSAAFTINELSMSPVGAVHTAELTFARYVMVRVTNATADTVGIGEVRVISGGTNVAAGKTVTASQAALAGSAVTQVVDGISNDSAAGVRNGYITSTATTDAWVQIDLGAVYQIDSIMLSSQVQTGGTAGRMANPTIYTSTASMSGQTVAQLQNNNNVTTTPFSGTPATNATTVIPSATNAAWVAGSTPTLTGSLGAPLGAGEQVAVFEGATFLGVATVSGSNWSFTTPALSNGLHTLTVQVENATGHVMRMAQQRTFFVPSTTPPTSVGTISSVTDDIGTGSVGGYAAGDATGNIATGTSSDDRRPTLAGTLTTLLAGGEVLRVFDGATYLGNATVNGLNWTFDPAGALAFGSHSFTVQVSNTVNGLNGTASAARGFVVQSMSVITATPRAGGNLASDITSDTQPILSGSVGATLGANEQLAVYIDGAFSGVATFNGLNWTYEIPAPLSAGAAHPVVVRIEDITTRAVKLAQTRTLTSTSSAAPTETVTITAVTDDVGTVIAYPAGNATGAIGAGKSTDDTTPVITGSLNALLLSGEVLEVFDGSTLLGQATILGDGTSWSYTHTNAAVGMHNYSARVRNTVTGLTGTASASAAIVETTLSDVTVTANTGTSNATGTTDRQPTLSGTLGFAMGNNEQLALYDDGVFLGLATVTGTSWSYTPGAQLALGAHNIQVQIEDATTRKVQLAKAATLNIVDTAAPTTTTSISSAEDDVGPLSGGGYRAGDLTGAFTSLRSTNDPTPTLGGTLSVALKAGEVVEIMEGTTVLGKAVVDGTSWTFNVPDIGVGSGQHVLRVRVTNTVTGLSGTLSPTFTLNENSISPITITTDSGFATVETPVVARYVMLRRLGVAGAQPIGLAEVQILSDGVNVARGKTVTVGPQGTSGGQIGSNLVDGNNSTSYLGNASTGDDWIEIDLGAFYPVNSISVMPMNAGGTRISNAFIFTSSSSMATRSVSSLAQDPAVTVNRLDATITSSSAIVISGGDLVQKVVSDTTPTLSGTLSAWPSGTEQVAVYDNGVFIGVATVAGGGTTWSFTPSTPLATGEHTIVVQIEETSTRIVKMAESQRFTIVPATAPTTTAVIASVTDRVASYAAGDGTGAVLPGSSINDTQPVLSGTVSAPLGATEAVQIFDGATLLGKAVVVGTNWTFTTPVLAVGSHTLTARVVNLGSNAQGPASAPVLVVEQVLQGIGVLPDSGTFTNQTTTDSTPVLSGALAAPLGTNEQIAVYDNGIYLGNATLTAGGWTFTPTTPLTVGSHVLKVQVEDATSHAVKMAVSQNVVIATTATPTTTVFISNARDAVGMAGSTYNASDAAGTITNGGSTDDAKPVLSGTISAVLAAGEVVGVYDGATRLGNATVEGTSWSYAIPTSLGIGMHNLTARVDKPSAYVSGTASPVYAINRESLGVPEVTADGGASQTTTTDVVRYVMVRLQSGTSSQLAISELQVMSNGVNVARGKAVTAGPQGTLGGSNVANLVDGNNATNWSAPAAGADQWVQVDLGGFYAVSSITLMPVATVAQSGSNHIFTSAHDMSGQSLASLLADATVKATTNNTVPATGATFQNVAPTIVVTGDSTPVLSGTIATALGAGEQLAVYDGATLLGAATVTGTTWTFTPSTALSTGRHALTVQIEDAATHVSRMGHQTAVVISAAGTPTSTATITSVIATTGAGHGTVSGAVPSGTSTDDPAPIITGTISAALRAGEAVQIFDGATLLGTATASGNTWRYEATTPLASGSHSLTARVVNLGASLMGTASAAYTIIEAGTGFSQVIADTGPILGDLMVNGGSTGLSGDNTPTLAGRLLAPLGTNEGVVLYDGATRLGQAVVAADGLSWTLAVTTPLSNGVHNLQARIQDLTSGSAHVQSTPFALTVNTTAPTNVALVEQVAATGTSKVGRGSVAWNVTSDATTDDPLPTISGSIGNALVAGEVVAIYDGALRIGTATVNGTAWSFVPSPLSQGAHTFTARVENGSAGSSSAPVVVRENTINWVSVNDGTLQTKPEKVRFITIGDYAAFTSMATPEEVAAALSVYSNGADIARGKPFQARWTGTAGVSISTFTLDLGDYYDVDAIVWRPVKWHDPTYTNGYWLSSGNQNPAGYSLNDPLFWQKDPYGSGAYFEGRDVVNTNYTPLVTVPRTMVVTSATPVISGTLGARMGAGEQLAIYEGSTLLGVATIAADGVSWSITMPAMTAGKHALVARIEDIATNTAHATSNYWITYDDGATPTVTATVSGDNGTTDSNGIAVNIFLSAALAPNQVVRLYDNGVLLGDAQLMLDSNPKDYAYNRPGAVWAPGVHNLTARVETTTGSGVGAVANTRVMNISSIATTAVTDDTGPTQGNLVAGGASSAGTDDSTPTLSGTLGSALMAGEQVAVYDGTTLLGAATVTGTTWSFTPATPLADGLHNLQARIENATTHKSGANAASLALTVATAAPTKTGAINNMVDDASGNVANGGTMSDATVNLLGTVSAALAAGEVLAVFDGGVRIGTATVVGVTWSFTTPALARGAHAFDVRVETPGGLAGPASAVYNATLTGAAPTQTTAITGVTSDVGTANVTSGVMEADATPNLRGTISAGLAAGEVVAVYNGTTFLGNATVSGTGWTYTTPALANGHHYLTARVEAGAARGAASNTFDVYAGANTPQTPVIASVIDDQGPLTGPVANGGSTNDNSLAFSGSISGYTQGEGGKLQLFEGSRLLTDATLAADGTWTASVNYLTDGAHTITARFTNAAGVVDANTATFSMTVSNAGGILTTITPVGGVQTLTMTGAGQTLDLGSATHNRIDEMQIDGTGANTLKLKLSDVLQAGTDLFNSGSGWAGLVSGGRHQMVINGGSDDTVQLDSVLEAGSWTLASTVSHGGHNYAVYNSTLVQAQILIDLNIKHAAAGAIM